MNVYLQNGCNSDAFYLVMSLFDSYRGKIIQIGQLFSSDYGDREDGDKSKKRENPPFF